MSLKALTVSGSHYECGRQVGSACAELIQRVLEDCQEQFAPGLRREDYRLSAGPYLAASRRAFPWVLDEIRGAAEGAGVEFIDLFIAAVEELFSSPSAKRCSDFALCPPASADHVLLAHNNDLSPASEENLLAIEWNFPDEPRLYTIGVGPFLSIGLNSKSIALTGNELASNDERPGIPRWIIARALLSAENIDEAVSIALHPERASSYNNIISSGDGRILNVEASATDHELLYPDQGWLVHTNHYVHPRMRQYEQNPGDIVGSVERYERACQLMQGCPRPVDLPALGTFLGDHDSQPVSLCWHDPEGKVKTVFSALIDLTGFTVDMAVGNPCQNEFRRLWG